MKRIIVLLSVAALMLGVLAAGAVYANSEDAAGAKCSEATLDGTYLFADNGFDITGSDQVPIAEAGYQVFNGNGKVKGVSSGNFNGEVFRNDPFSATYTVKADCTGTVTYTDGSQIDMFIAPDGSMFTSVQTKLQTKSSELVRSGFELRGRAKRVED